MSLDEVIDKIFVVPESKLTLNKLCLYGSKSESVLEFGTRGGVSALAMFKALTHNGTPKWRPRFIGVDLVNDDSIKRVETLADKSGISFSFVECHTRQYPLHETDAFVWDTFHSGGSLSIDLERVSPYVHKYIYILGVKTYGNVSEAITRNLDITNVAKELYVSEENAKKGLNQAIQEFLQKHTEWKQVDIFGEICVLERIGVPLKRVF